MREARNIDDFRQTAKSAPHDLASVRIAKEPWAWRASLYAANALTPTVRFVGLFYQERFVNRSLGYAFPSHAEVAKEIGLSERSVRRALSELVEAGFLRLRRRRFNSSNELMLSMPDQPATSGHMLTEQSQANRPSVAGPSGHQWPPNLRLEPSNLDTPYRASVEEGQSDPAPSEGIPIGKEVEQELIGPASEPKRAISTFIASHFGIPPGHGRKIYNELPDDTRRALNWACLQGRLRRCDVLRAV